jgi:hypothetical protein
MNTISIPPYVQEHMHLVHAIRTGEYVNEGETTALSTLTALWEGLQPIQAGRSPG